MTPEAMNTASRIINEHNHLMLDYGIWFDNMQREIARQIAAAHAQGAREHSATLEKYQSDLDKLHAALGQSNLEVAGGFIEHVCAHLRHVRKEVLRLADLDVITIGRAGEILGLTVRQAREEMRKYQEAQSSALRAGGE